MVDSKGTRPSSMGSNTSSRSSSMSFLAEPLLLSLDGTDPLSQFAKQEEEMMDPLTQMATEYVRFCCKEKTSNFILSIVRNLLKRTNPLNVRKRYWPMSP